jgi:hypothetical protein
MRHGETKGGTAPVAGDVMGQVKVLDKGLIACRLILETYESAQATADEPDDGRDQCQDHPSYCSHSSLPRTPAGRRQADGADEQHRAATDHDRKPAWIVGI